MILQRFIRSGSCFSRSSTRRSTKIIDVIFTTAVDVESQQAAEEVSPPQEGTQDEEYRQIRTAPDLLNAKRENAVDAFAALRGKELVKRSRTLFWSPDKEFRVCCAVSKRYEGVYQPYWYAFHPKWDEFLVEGTECYFILSCMDLDYAFAVRYSWIDANKKNLNMTDRGDRSYWHIALTTLESGELAINVSRIGQELPLNQYRFEIKDGARRFRNG